jgi:hypothetical protein
MKSARVVLWNAQPSQNPKAPILNGSVELPCQLIWELAQQMQAGHGLEVNAQTGEQFFKLRVSVWAGDPTIANGPALNGQIESPAERAAYLATKAAGGAQQFGAQPAQQQPWAAQAAAHLAQPAAPVGPPQWQQPAAPAPAPAAAPAPPAWGAPAPGGWGG